MSDTSYTRECLAFALTPGIGAIGFKRLIAHFGDPNMAFQASKSECSLCLNATVCDRLQQYKNGDALMSKILQYQKDSISIITQYSPLYPPLLKHIPDPPICLFAIQKDMKPQTALDGLYIALVGSRRHSAYGETVATQLTSELSIAGTIIVSGLALGIDALVHKATLATHGKTIAVLGCGPDVIYPPFNRDLYHHIITSGNTIISEFPPGTKPFKGSFVSRNRLISGISRGVVVIEGTTQSGSLTTARHAAIQGRDVFAVPGHITSTTAQAPLLLLKQGAKLVSSAQDVLTEYGVATHTQKNARTSLTPDQAQLVQLLSIQSHYADELAVQMHVHISQIMTLVTLLEIQNIIHKDEEGRYVLV